MIQSEQSTPEVRWKSAYATMPILHIAANDREAFACLEFSCWYGFIAEFMQCLDYTDLQRIARGGLERVRAEHAELTRLRSLLAERGQQQPTEDTSDGK